MADATGPCECGAPSECRPIWYSALAEEQLDPIMGQWHNPLVCIFALQHASMYNPKFADGQFRFLQLFVEKGSGAVNAVARSLRAKNRGAGADLDAPELLEYEPIPSRELPGSFDLSLHHLLAEDGEFITDGHDAYGSRMRELAQATIAAWAS